MKVYDEFFRIGVIFGFILGVAFLGLFMFISIPSQELVCAEDQPKIGQGRELVGSCPELCYDYEHEVFVRFERTSTNLNVIFERSGEVIVFDGLLIDNYYVEDGYYYADIDDVTQLGGE